MEKSWQMKCSSSWQTLPPSSSSELPQQGSQNQVEMNADKFFYPDVTQGLHSADSRIVREPMVFNTLNPGACRSRKPELGNSFLALLSGPSPQFQSGVQQVASSKPSISSGKLPMVDGSIVFNGEGCGVPLSAVGLSSQHQGSSNMGNEATHGPAAPARAASTSTTSRVSVLHDFQMENLTYRTDMNKSALLPPVGASRTGADLSSAQWGWLVSLNPTTAGQNNTANIQASRKSSSVTKSAVPDSFSAFVRGRLRVFCLATGGDLLISNTGLIGVVCSCHGLQMSISKFCEHSGLSAVNPGNAVRLESGETVSQWRRVHLHKSGIRIPDDNSGWDWPEKVTAAGGLVETNTTMQNTLKNSGMFQLPDPSVVSARSGQRWNNLGSPNNFSMGEGILEKTCSKVIHNAQKRNTLEGCNVLNKNLVGTMHNILPPELDDRTMPAVKESSIPGGLALLKSPLENSRDDGGYQSISDYINFLTKGGYPSRSNQGLEKLKIYGTDPDVNRSNSSREAFTMERNAIASNIELRLGQPSQQSHTLDGSVISAMQPQPFNALNNCPKSQIQDPVFHSSVNPRVADGSRQNVSHAPSDTPCLKRQSESQLNLMHLTSRSCNVTEPPKVEHFKADVVRSSQISTVLSDLITSETNFQSWANVNMVNYNEPFMSRVLNGESYGASNPSGFSRSRNGGMELNINELGNINYVDKGKGTHHIADNDAYVAPMSNSLFHNKQMNGPSPLTGVVNRHRLPTTTTTHEKQCFYRCQPSGIPDDASGISNMSGQLSNISCPGSSIHLDHARLRSINSSAVTAGSSFPSLAATTNFSSTSPICIPNLMPTFCNKESFDVSPHFLDESLRLFAPRHIVDSSKHDHTIAYCKKDSEQQSLCSPSTVEVARRGSTLGPSVSEQQKEQHFLTTKQDAPEFSLQQIQTFPTHYIDRATEKLADVAGVNNWCNLSTNSQQGISFISKEHYIHNPPHNSRTNEQPLLRLGRAENGCLTFGEHGTCNQNEASSDFAGKCSCAVHPMSFVGNCVSRGQATVDACKAHVGRISGDTSKRVASILDNVCVVRGDKTTLFHHCENLNRQSTAQNDCHASQWRDVPNKRHGVRNAIGTERPAAVIEAKANVEDQSGETISKGLNGTQEAESLNEQQMSNVCSGFSAPAVTEVTVEVNNRDSCSMDAGNARYVSGHVIDEESGIEKCCSSDNALESERSTETVNTSRKFDLIEGGSSSALPVLSSHGFTDNRRFSNSFGLKKLQNQLPAGSSLQGNIKQAQQFKSELRNGKRKKATKWKSLDAAFPVSGLLSLRTDSPKETGHTELQPRSPRGTLMPSQPNHGLRRKNGIYSTEPSRLKRKCSALYSSKTLSQKRDLDGLDDDHRDWEDDGQTLSKNEMKYRKISKLSGDKKLKQCSTPDVSGQLQGLEINQVDAGKSAKFISVDCVKEFSSSQVGTCVKKARPVVCGKSGIISNGKLAEGRAKPAKIVSLSMILRTAKRFSPEPVEPIMTSVSGTNKPCLSRGNICIGKPSVLEEVRTNTTYRSGLKNKVKAVASTSEKKACFRRNEICFTRCNEFSEKPSVSDESRDNESHNTVLKKEVKAAYGIKKACSSRSESLAVEPSMLKTENIGHRTLKHNILHKFSSAPLKSRFKEARKRSLSELEGKGKDIISEKYKETSKVHNKLGSHGKSYIKKIYGSKCRRGELRQVGTKKPIKESKCQDFVLDSDAFCCVCGSSNKDEINCLLECSDCSIRVHQACYGVSRVPKGRWCCRPCRAKSKNIVCVLCGYEGGAMTRALRTRNIIKSLLKVWSVGNESTPRNLVPYTETLGDELTLLDSSSSGNEVGLIPATAVTDQSPAAVSVLNSHRGRDDIKTSSVVHGNFQVHNTITAGVIDPTIKQWVHMVCGLWTPGTRCPNVDTMSTFDVSGAPIPSKDVVCSLCSRPGGSCIKCRVVNCSVHFHPWCAHQKGLLQSEVEGIDNEMVGFYGRCMLHATFQGCGSVVTPVDSKLVTRGRGECTCARTEGYKGRKKDGFTHNICGLSDDSGGCLVPQEQINAWLHINRQKSCTRALVKPLASDIEYDCRKEYARYKQTKGWKNLVVYKSGIHALGLYTSQFICRGAMVVEYVGEIVGLRVADKREVEYQFGKKLPYKGACYFFRIDKEHIIDATRKGGIARFVNHSCLPNCVAKIISVRNEKKVVFFAERDINPGEEITYDYHFNHEDEGKKIPCFCNSKNCRRYLN